MRARPLVQTPVARSPCGRCCWRHRRSAIAFAWHAFYVCPYGTLYVDARVQAWCDKARGGPPTAKDGGASVRPASLPLLAALVETTSQALLRAPAVQLLTAAQGRQLLESLAALACVPTPKDYLEPKAARAKRWLLTERRGLLRVLPDSFLETPLHSALASALALFASSDEKSPGAERDPAFAGVVEDAASTGASAPAVTPAGQASQSACALRPELWADLLRLTLSLACATASARADSAEPSALPRFADASEGETGIIGLLESAGHHVDGSCGLAAQLLGLAGAWLPKAAAAGVGEAFVWLLEALLHVVRVCAPRLKKLGPLCSAAVDAFATAATPGLASLAADSPPASVPCDLSAPQNPSISHSESAARSANAWRLMQLLLLQLLDSPTDADSPAEQPNTYTLGKGSSGSVADREVGDLRLALQLKLVRCLGSDVLTASLHSAHTCLPTQAALLHLLAKGARAQTAAHGGCELALASLGALFEAAHTSPSSEVCGLAHDEAKDTLPRNQGVLEDKEMVRSLGERDLQSRGSAPLHVAVQAAPLLIDACADVLLRGLPSKFSSMPPLPASPLGVAALPAGADAHASADASALSPGDSLKRFVLDQLMLLKLHPRVARAVAQAQTRGRGRAETGEAMEALHSGERGHLVALYPVLVACVALNDGSLRARVAQCLILAGQQLGLPL